MDEQKNQDILNGTSMEPQVTEPTVASSLNKNTPAPSQTNAQPLEHSQSSDPIEAETLTLNAQPTETQLNQAPQLSRDNQQSVNGPQINQTQPTSTDSHFQQTTTPASGGVGIPTIGNKSLKTKWFLPAILAGFLVLGGAAAAYVAVFQKSPEKLWSSALSNTINGIEKYLDNSYDTEQKGFAIEGNFKVSSPVAIDGSMKGQWYESNGSLIGDVGAGGVRINTELRTIALDSNSTPDIYMKVSGLEGIDSLIESLGGYGSNVGTTLGDVNNQWFFIDHTLIDQYLASAAGESSAPEFTEQDAKETIDKMMVVLKERMFGTSDDKAVFKITDKIGKEDYEGTPSYKMTVKVDQNNFKDFVVALKDAAKETKLNDLFTQGQDSKTLEEVLDFDELIKELEKADFSKLSADVWVESNGGYIRNVRIYPVEDKKDTNYLDFGMDYKGGDVFPFLIRATVDDNGSTGTLAFGFDINQNNGDGKMTFKVDMSSNGAPIKAEGELSIVGSNDTLNIEKPAGAKSYLEFVSSLTSGLYQDPYNSPLYDNNNLDFNDPNTVFPIDDIEL